MIEPCHIYIGDASLPASNLEGVSRLVLGHRRLTSNFAAAIDAYSLQSTLCQTWSASHLLSGSALPEIDVAFTSLAASSERLGAARYALSVEGVAAIHAWLEQGNPHAPIGGRVDGQRAVMLILAGRASGPFHESLLRSSKTRQREFEKMFPQSPIVAELLCGNNIGGLERERIQDALVDIMRRGFGDVFDLGTDPMHAQRVGQFVRHIVTSGLVEILPPKPRLATIDECAVLQAPAWTAIRQHLRRCGASDNNGLDFGLRLARRSSVRRSLPENVDTDAARAERHGLAMTQQIIGSMMLHHPGSIWSTASLLSQPITLHPANSPRAGHPTTKNGRDSFGQTVTGHRTPDGSVWFEPGGYPDLLVEFEGDRSRLRIVEHIEAALWQSSVMRRPTTLVVGTTTRSDGGVRRAINSYISRREPWMHRADWPFANVLVRVARASALRSVCPLHGDVDEQWLLRV